MALTFLDRVKVAVTGTPGTGTLSLGAAVAGYRTFDAASAADGAYVSYVIEDGTAWEIGHGTYHSAGPTLTRTVVLETSTGAAQPINATSAAVVFTSLLAADLNDIVASIGAASGGGGAAPASGVTIKQFKAICNSASAQFDNPPTAGNLIVAVLFHYNNGPITNSGWTALDVYNGSANDGGGIYYRTSDGTETGQLNPANISNNSSLVLYELAGVPTGRVPVLITEFEGPTGQTHVESGSFTPAKPVLAFFIASRYSDTAAPTFASPLVTDASATNGNRGVQGSHAELPAAAVNLSADYTSANRGNLAAFTVTAA